MIVVLNVKITDHRIGYPYDNGRGPWQPRSNRFDIFKYCLASYAVLAPLVKKFHFYIALGPEYAGREQELEAYCKELFPSDKLDLHHYRNNHTRDWRKTCDEILSDDNEVIWFGGNDDHIFIDYDLDMVAAGIKNLQADPDPHAVVYYSHWPEQMRMSRHFNGQLTEDGNFVKFHWDNFDGIHMFKAARMRRYWFDADYGDELVFRPDDLYNHWHYTLPATYYAPIREMVRHYDGYIHTGDVVRNTAPPLFIPPGFLDGNMKVRFGFTDRDNLWTNCNPTMNLYNADPEGADYRFVPEDIPLFWKSRITETAIAPNYNTQAMNSARNTAYLNLSRLPISCFGIHFGGAEAHPPEWFFKYFRT